jgi:SH3-like domain-containing protein
VTLSHPPGSRKNDRPARDNNRSFGHPAKTGGRGKATEAERVGRVLLRRLRWVVPTFVCAFALLLTLAAADPIDPAPVDPARSGTASDVTRADSIQTLPALARVTSASAVAAGTETGPERRGPVTGFALPRFVSLGASEANARRGPSRSHRIDWVFTRRGMPVMIVAEHGHWRRVVDRDGVGGWMHYSLLSGVRTAIVEQDMLALYTRPDTDSPVRARAELGVIGRLVECRPDWCLMESGGYRGWVDKAALWGVEPGDIFD